MIYGKIFSTMFEGSMVGAGSDVFAVMAYAISHMQPGKDRDEFVRLHPKILAVAIGETEARMKKAIEYLCSPDRETTTPGEKGKRLVRVEQFIYRVVNGKHYRAIIDEKDRLAKAAMRQANWREREKLKTKAGQDEVAQDRALEELEEKSRMKEHKKRLKVAVHNGTVTGARQAIKEGFEESEG